MLLTNPQIKYMDLTGSWVKMNDVIACDINTSLRPGRNTQDATGLYTNNFIDNCRIIFKKGSTPVIDNLRIGETIELQVYDGSKWIQVTFTVSARKYNEKDFETTNTILVLAANDEIPQIIVSDASKVTATWGAIGGDIADQNDLISKLDKKVNKQETTTDNVYVYSYDKTGDTNYRATSAASGSTVAIRGTNGVLAVGTPTADSHATTKLYVDTQSATKVDKSTSSQDFKLGVDANGIYIEQ